MSEEPNGLDRLRMGNPRRMIVFAVLVLLITFALLFWARDVIREVFVLPLSYLVWAIQTILIVVPEIYQWLFVVAIGLVVAYRALAGRRKKAVQSIPLQAELEYDRQYNFGRVRYWQNKIELIRAGSSAYYQSTFHNTLGRLLIDLLAHRYRLTPFQVEERLHEDPVSERALPLGQSLPPEIREYVLISLGRGDMTGATRWALFLRRIREALQTWFLFRSRKKKSTAQASLDPRLARILQYMEEELEVPNGDTSR